MVKLPRKFNALCQADQRQIIADLLKKNREEEAELLNISRMFHKTDASIKVEDRPDLANLKDLNNVD